MHLPQPTRPLAASNQTLGTHRRNWELSDRERESERVFVGEESKSAFHPPWCEIQFSLKSRQQFSNESPNSTACVSGERGRKTPYAGSYCCTFMPETTGQISHSSISLFFFLFLSVGSDNRLFLAISCPLSVFLGSQGTNGEQGTWKSFFYDKGKQATNVQCGLLLELLILGVSVVLILYLKTLFIIKL